MKKFLPLIFCAVILASCAPEPYVKTLPQPPVPQEMPGTYHKVERGQTLWRISKLYDVELDEIVKTNRITDAANIEVGQLIFIPNRKQQVSAPASSSGEDFIWPVKGHVIAAFGMTVNSMINRGINIEPRGNSDVLAARSGRVTFYADNFGAFGKTIIIDHGDGFSTVYARNDEVFIKPGDSVQRGAVIAKAGSAGRDRQEYLHFEIRKGAIAQNPNYYLPK